MRGALAASWVREVYTPVSPLAGDQVLTSLAGKLGSTFKPATRFPR